jgi:hypothetical protein
MNSLSFMSNFKLRPGNEYRCHKFLTKAEKIFTLACKFKTGRLNVTR